MLFSSLAVAIHLDRAAAPLSIGVSLLVRGGEAMLLLFWLVRV